MNILDHITTAIRITLQPGDVLFLDVGQSGSEIVDEKEWQEEQTALQKVLNDAFGHEVKFVLTCDITPTIVEQVV